MPSYSTQNRVSQAVHGAADSSRHFVSEHPMSMALTAFGLGLGVGVAIAFLATDGASARQDSGLAHLGRRVLDAVAHAVPSSLTPHGR